MLLHENSWDIEKNEALPASGNWGLRWLKVEKVSEREGDKRKTLGGGFLLEPCGRIRHERDLRGDPQKNLLLQSQNL